jgi:hypothetical protein
MATELSPVQVGEIATSAYVLRLSTDMSLVEDALPHVRDAFDIGDGDRLVGATGVALQSHSGFGYVAWGVGPREGECLITVRGTVTGYDWLTNVRFAGITGPSGYMVHTGFWRGAQSVLPQIREQLQGRNPSVLHIVGHSLGGAMATLLADALSNTGCLVKLYTFGAPRSGVEEHAQYLTAKLGDGHIYRAYHDTDPVPMVPVFPYFHIPFGSNAYRLKGAGTLISVPSHLMPSYRKSVAGCTWASLPVLLPQHNSFEAASDWLAQAAKDNGPFIMMSATALRLILSALDWIVKQLGRGVALQLFAGATLLDGLARLLYSGALQSIQMAEAVAHLMNAALRFMGRAAIATVNISVAFIEYVLGLLFRFIAAMARRATDLLD